MDQSKNKIQYGKHKLLQFCVGASGTHDKIIWAQKGLSSPTPASLLPAAHSWSDLSLCLQSRHDSTIFTVLASPQCRLHLHSFTQWPLRSLRDLNPAIHCLASRQSGTTVQDSMTP